MPLAISSTKSAGKPRLRQEVTLSPFGSVYSMAEINAYIAIRNDLLAEAEELRTPAKLDSAALANDFVLGCLRPARPPYEAQCLPETDAVLERKRCEVVRDRLAELRASVA
jgi:hypothetical protein